MHFPSIAKKSYCTNEDFEGGNRILARLWRISTSIFFFFFKKRDLSSIVIHRGEKKISQTNYEVWVDEETISRVDFHFSTNFFSEAIENPV